MNQQTKTHDVILEYLMSAGGFGPAAPVPNKNIPLEWTWVAEDACWRTEVPTLDHLGLGRYVIYAVRRPNYCDRGRWHVLVDNEVVKPPDGAEGFPRYFFKIENLKDEMELWVNAREECQRATLTPRNV